MTEDERRDEFHALLSQRSDSMDLEEDRLSTLIEMGRDRNMSALEIESSHPSHNNSPQIEMEASSAYFILVSIPWHLLHLPKLLWFEHHAYHHARNYSTQILSIATLFLLLQILFYALLRWRTGYVTSTFSSNVLLSVGALDRQHCLCYREYYRILSQMFLTRGLTWLRTSVMWQLWYCGYYSVLFGATSFSVIWVSGGVFGALYRLITETEDDIIAGPDDAICACHVAYLTWILYHWYETPPTFFRSYVRNCNFALIAFTVISSLTTSESTSFGVGGAVAGFLLGTVLFNCREADIPPLMRQGSDDEDDTVAATQTQRQPAHRQSSEDATYSFTSVVKMCAMTMMTMLALSCFYFLVAVTTPATCPDEV